MIIPVTNVSAGRLGGLLGLNRTDSGLVGLFGRDRSDPAAHAKHYAQLLLKNKYHKKIED